MTPRDLAPVRKGGRKPEVGLHIASAGSVNAGAVGVPNGRSAPALAAHQTILSWVAYVLAVASAVSPLFSGYYDIRTWEPLALAAIVLVLILCRSVTVRFSKQGAFSSAGLLLLLGLSAVSILWAESREAAWTDTNRLALYCLIFAGGLVAIREGRSARMVMLILGASALITSTVLCCSFTLGGGAGAFLSGRLNAPIGYINGTAGLLVMGIWPWLAAAEMAPRRALRSVAVAAATAIACTCVLTQSRAIVPAALVAGAMVVLCARGRVRRAINMLLVLAGVVISLPWTLAVYSSNAGTGATHDLGVGSGVLRSAGVSILVLAICAGACHYAGASAAGRLPAVRRALSSPFTGRVMALATALVVIVAAVAGSSWLGQQYRAFTSLHVTAAASSRFVDAGGYRYDLWRIAMREFDARPLTGWGAGNYDVEYYRLRRNPDYVMQPHSIELQMAAELGIGGLLALGLFLGGVFWGGLAQRNTLAARDRFIRVAAVGMFTAWFVHTSVDWLYDIPGITAMALLAAAALVVPAESIRVRQRRESQRGLRRLAVSMIALVVFGVLAASIGRQYIATRYQQSGMTEVTHSPGTAIRTLREAFALDPYSLSSLYALASAFARKDDYIRARAALEIAVALEPHNYVPPALLGDLAKRAGYRGTAIRDYQRAISLDPNDPTLRQEAIGAMKGRM